MTVVVDPRKSERVLYAPGALPVIVDVPDLHFLMIDGEGAPDVSKGHQQAVEALYGVASTLRFALKREADIDHPVMPLEGLWWVAGGVLMIVLGSRPGGGSSPTPTGTEPAAVTAPAAEATDERYPVHLSGVLTEPPCHAGCGL